MNTSAPAPLLHLVKNTSSLYPPHPALMISTGCETHFSPQRHNGRCSGFDRIRVCSFYPIKIGLIYYASLTRRKCFEHSNCHFHTYFIIHTCRHTNLRLAPPTWERRTIQFSSHWHDLQCVIFLKMTKDAIFLSQPCPSTPPPLYHLLTCTLLPSVDLKHSTTCRPGPLYL